jgi:hypothetical protein
MANASSVPGCSWKFMSYLGGQSTPIWRGPWATSQDRIIVRVCKVAQGNGIACDTLHRITYFFACATLPVTSTIDNNTQKLDTRTAMSDRQL